jgi:hypothetical protein
MSMTDQEAAAAWKKAQGQVNGKSDMNHFKPALIWFTVLFVGTALVLRFYLKHDWAESLVIAVFCSLLGTLRITLRMLRNR